MQNRIDKFLDFLFVVLKGSLLLIPFSLIVLTCYGLINLLNEFENNKEIPTHKYSNILNLNDSTLNYLIIEYFKDDKISIKEYENIFKTITKKQIIQKYLPVDTLKRK